MTGIDVTPAVQAAAEALWVTEHFPVDENDMRLPSADHPDFVQMEVMTYPSVTAAITAALPALAEQFAALIEARAANLHANGASATDRVVLTLFAAARLIREAATTGEVSS